MSSHWYEAVIEKFGTVESFIDQLCEKQGLTEEEAVQLFYSELRDSSNILSEVKVTIDGVECGSIWL